MKVTIFSAYACNTPHFETDLEIAQRHLDSGDSVTLLVCNSELLICDPHPPKDIPYCLYCIGRRVTGFGLLTGRVKVRSFLELRPQNRRELCSLADSKCWSGEMFKYRVDGFEVGQAVRSSMISWHRDPYIRAESPECSRNTANMMVSTLTVYRSMLNYIDRNPVDRVYVFNGRYGIPRAVLRACQARKVLCITHERGCDPGSYSLWHGTMPHDLVYVEQLIRRMWSETGENVEREKVAAEFYTSQMRGGTGTWFSMVECQKRGLLPDGWLPGEKNIVIFNSSEDEFAAFEDEYKGPIYQSQKEGIEKILSSLREDHQGVRIYLRVHPNLRGVRNEQTRWIEELSEDFLSVIPADSAVSTYSLLQNADKVVTFGSTVGIEATFWGIPSILAGRCAYQNLGSTYNPTDHEELMRLLREDLPVKDRTGALMYGYFVRTYGVPHKYFKSTGVFDGLFKEVKVVPAEFQKKLTRWYLKSWVRVPIARVFTLVNRWRLMRRFSMRG